MTAAEDSAADAGNIRGITALSIGMACLVVNDVLMKLSSVNLPIGQLMFMRGLVATALISVFCVFIGAHRQVHQVLAPPVMARSLVNVAASFCYITALFNLPIANVTSILQATPLLLTALAALLLKEDVGWRRWAAIGVGFFGVLLIVKPDAGGFNAYSLFAVTAILFVSARDLLTKIVRADVPSIIVTLATSIAVTIAGGLYSLVEGWSPVNMREFLFVSAAALFLVFGYHLTIVAMRVGEIAVVSPFRFSIVLWAILGGYLIWGEVPETFTILGIGLIVTMGAYTFHRERLRNLPKAPVATDTRREI